ncbi:MAG: 2-oxoacid:ferredoxin oxidoreductase subunit beta, partial [Planctomycetes bacterium]|nr:2-oxoacid:ferredoxin oxidoreductase subunit beta [Planctomycetota bacterium]
NKGIRLNGITPEVVSIGKDCAIDDLLIHDAYAEQPTLAYLLSRMVHPQFPECIGIFRSVQKPTYDELLEGQIESVTKAKGKGDLDKLFRNDDLWVVE